MKDDPTKLKNKCPVCDESTKVEFAPCCSYDCWTSKFELPTTPSKKTETEQCTIPSVTTRLSLDNFVINPVDKDNDFEINIEGDFHGDAYTYLNKEQALKLAKYILDSFNVC
jgi:hypothetical protein